MPYIDYAHFLSVTGATSPAEVLRVFEQQVVPEWIENYQRLSGLHGDVTTQQFQGYTYGFDHAFIKDSENTCSIPDHRVVFAFGLTAESADPNNRTLMRSFWGSNAETFDHLEGDYDKGHFIAHLSGGPIDINLFPQLRELNRGWSDDGKKYREMEKHVARHPGTFVFSRPLYSDYSCCPAFIEYGYFDTEGKLEFRLFPNKVGMSISRPTSSSR